jgi:hypothetical protein
VPFTTGSGMKLSLCSRAHESYDSTKMQKV